MLAAALPHQELVGEMVLDVGQGILRKGTGKPANPVYVTGPAVAAAKFHQFKTRLENMKVVSDAELPSWLDGRQMAGDGTNHEGGHLFF